MFDAKLLFYPGNDKGHFMNTNSVTFFNENDIDSLPGDRSLIFAVWEIVNPGNIGNIIWVAHNLGALKVFFITKNKQFKISKIKKTAGFSFDQMKWEFISPDDFIAFSSTDYKLVILETCNVAENIYQTAFPQKAIILAGSESYGLPPEWIEKGSKKFLFLCREVVNR